MKSSLRFSFAFLCVLRDSAREIPDHRTQRDHSSSCPLRKTIPSTRNNFARIWCTKLQLGLVLNFGLERMKDGLTRIVNGLPEPLSPSTEIE
jgi:hypothetical protein